MPSTWSDYAQNYVGTNMPLMRYANVLLMKAEVYNEQGHPEKAIPLINEVRSVHGKLPAMTGSDQAAVKAQIEHERLVEFTLENSRFYDLRRWGKLDEAMKADGRTGFSAPTHSILPLPPMEIQPNNEIHEQSFPPHGTSSHASPRHCRLVCFESFIFAPAKIDHTIFATKKTT